MGNSPLVDYIKISPNRGNYINGILKYDRNHDIDTITIHCVVGQVTVERLGEIFTPTAKQASSNYGVGLDGKIGMYVEEKDRSWCSSNSANDNRAITIEVASDTKHPYAVTNAAYKSLIKLLVDICKRNNIKELKWKADKSLIGQIDKQNMTVHRWFANKSCPGDYLYKRHGQIANEVNKQLKASSKMDAIYRVRVGAFRKKEQAIASMAKVKAAGFAPCVVTVGGMYYIQLGAYKNKENANNIIRKAKAAGFAPHVSTTGAAAVATSNKKSIDEIAREVIKGKWGVGSDRKSRLTKAGYDYAAVQKRVNELL